MLAINQYLASFNLNVGNGLFDNSARSTRIDYYDDTVPQYINEYWTAKQRQANSIHEISYRACFKPQLPRFFIELLTKENDLIYDPFFININTLCNEARTRYN
jgi:DNA modification methylase